MGMLVTGSISSPRIFISTSIMISENFLYHQFTQKTVGKTARCHHSHICPETKFCVRGSGKIKHLVLRCAPDPLPTRVVLPFNHYFESRSQMSLVALLPDRSLFLVEHRQTAYFFLIRDRIVQA